MKMPKPRAISPSPSHEEIFIQRYRWVMGWALRLTNHDRQQAEDLVHDTFVQFMINQPDLGIVEQNIEGYLYGMLRNMHISQVRRALRLRETAFPLADILSISETASVREELRVVGQKIQVQDELCRVCQYASIRKNSSKVGSAVVLRFFHGYYPNEIAAVTRSSRAGVDKMLQRARTEARLYLKDPDSLVFLHGEQPPPELQIKFGQEPEDLLSELREALYRSRSGECFSVEQLRETYQAKEADTLTPQKLAHIVCCGVCLDEVNKLLGLPLLAAREPERMAGRDKRDRGKRGGGPGDGSGSTGDLLEKSRRRLKDVLEHRPKELRVSVNGFILGSHRINSQLNNLSINAKGEEKIGFVEVFSEDEVRLLFCMVDAPPDGPVERRVTAALSDDRSLELFLDFSDSWPNLNVTYNDPTFQSTESGVEDLESEEMFGTEASVRTGSSSERVDRSARSANASVPSALGSLSRHLVTRLRHRLSDFRPSKFDHGLLLRPGTVTAVVALILIASLLLIYRRAPGPALTAADLLHRSINAEEGIVAGGSQVVHRTMQLEQRKLPGRELVAQSRVESWEGKGISARRQFDSQNKLIAAEWARVDGSRVLYQHGSKLTFQSAKDVAKQGDLAAGDIWKAIPSAKEFSALNGAAGAHVEERGNVYVLSVGSVNNSASSAIAFVPAAVERAVLVLNRADLHSIEQTLVIREGNEQREYHFVETAYERRSPQSVAPGVFEPDTELLSAKMETRNSKPESETLSPGPQPPTPVVAATAAMEVEVLRLLSQISADMAQEVTVKRESDGALHVEAIVDSAKRKGEIISALSPVAHDRAVKIRIETVAEAQVRIQREKRRAGAQSGSSDISLDAGTTANAIPVDAEVRRYLRSKGTADKQLDDEVSRLSNRMLNHSHQALFHAFAMKNLVERFSSDDLRSLDADAHAKWRAMIATHADKLQRELAAIRQELAPIFGATASSSREGVEVGDDAALFRAVTRLAELASFTNESIQSAFTISSANKSVAIRTSLFWSSLGNAEQLARRIQATDARR